MSTDDGDGGVPANPGRPRYNRPRRYPVQAPALATDAGQDITRQNPSLTEAAQDWGRRTPDVPAPPTGTGPGPVDAPGAYRQPAAVPQPYPYPAEGAPSGYPPPPAAGQPAFDPAGPPRTHGHTPSTRVLLIAAAVVVVLAVVIGLVVGLSGGDDGSQAGGPSTPTAGTATSRTATSAGATAAPTAAPSTPVAGNGGATSATATCATLGATSPFSLFVARPRPAERLPVSYVEPQSGTKTAVCVGLFRAAAGTGRGRLGYLAEYAQLPATRYALTLKTLGWTLVPNLPRPTYRNTFRTTVTLVQQGTSLVTVIGDGT